MKPAEKDIIKHLRKGKRVNISQIARNLGVPITTVADRIKRIEERYIMKRSSLIDYSKMGYTANEIIAIKVASEKRDEFLRYIKNENCVNSIFSVNSDFSFVIELVCKDRLELFNWVDATKRIFPIETVSFQVLRTEEKEKFVPE